MIWQMKVNIRNRSIGIVSFCLYGLLSAICCMVPSCLFIMILTGVFFLYVFMVPWIKEWWGWILLPAVPFVIIYRYRLFPANGVINAEKLMLGIILLICTVFCIQLFLFVRYRWIGNKKENRPSVFLVGLLLFIYLGLVFYCLNFYGDVKNEVSTRNVCKTEAEWRTQYYYFSDEDESVNCTGRNALLCYDYPKVVVTSGDGLFGIGYENVFVKGCE